MALSRPSGREAPDLSPVAPGFDLGAFLPYRLAVAAARVSRAFADRYRLEFGLSIPEWRLIAHLAAASGPVAMRDIQARVDMDKSKVSRAAARLQSGGLVVKAGNPADRRSLTLSLTPEGRALVARLVPVADAFQAELLDRLGPEGAALGAALARLERLP
jgi:DNA-binding MarR family transcriptional regulator